MSTVFNHSFYLENKLCIQCNWNMLWRNSRWRRKCQLKKTKISCMTLWNSVSFFSVYCFFAIFCLFKTKQQVLSIIGYFSCNNNLILMATKFLWTESKTSGEWLSREQKANDKQVCKPWYLWLACCRKKTSEKWKALWELSWKLSKDNQFAAKKTTTKTKTWLEVCLLCLLTKDVVKFIAWKVCKYKT